jgi:molecular chaperone Hsp33
VTTGDLHRFSFDGLPVRGALVRLTTSWQEALRRRASVGAFPPAVRSLLGEMSAAGTLMQSAIKFDGALVLQLNGDGPLRMAVAEVTSALSFRATAQVVAAIDGAPELGAMVNVDGGGRCAITLDPRDRPAGKLPYQGIVPLEDARGASLRRLSDALEFYMLQSEQLATRFVLAANDEIAAGLMLQHMPPGADAERHERPDPHRPHAEFERLATLGASLTAEELLGLPPADILRRLFWAEQLRQYEPRDVAFVCSCSRARVQGMLVGLGRAEVEDIIAERGEVEVGCDFCGEHYRFDAVDVGGLFTPARDQPGATDTVQ